MPASCIAYNCTNRYYKGSGISFHRFPLRKPDLLLAWILNIRRKNWMPSNRSRLCSKHFTPDDYANRPGEKVKILKRNAVPTVFDFTKKSKRKRKLIKGESFNKECKENEEPTANDIKEESIAKTEKGLTVKPYICYLSTATNSASPDKT